jgi:1,4-alpha-glucan branching enzyme
LHITFKAQPELLPQRTANAIRFMYDGSAQVTSVALAGTFNCWVGDACMLRRESPTRWSCALPLAPGRHLYKFVIDGQAWIPDPANPWISEDGQNNSCLTITEDGEVFIRDVIIGPESPAQPLT